MSETGAPEPAFDLVEIAPGRRLHCHVQGPEDAPFVLFDAGAFGIYADGWWLQENLKKDYRVCLYDRAGMGASDAVPDGVTPSPDFHVDDMRRLVAALGRKGPFLLAGHSMAGLRLHAYANLYPEDLRGLVFIDALSPARLGQKDGRFLWANYGLLLKACAYGAGAGLAGPVSKYFPNTFRLEGRQREDKVWSYGAERHLGATRNEVVAIDHDAPWFGVEAVERLPVAIFASTFLNGMTGKTALRARENTGYGTYTVRRQDDHVTILTGDSCVLICDAVRAIDALPVSG